MTLHTPLQILDASHAGEARRVAVGLAAAAGFDASDSGRVALVVTEAATNIAKHARQGLLLLRGMPEVPGKGGIEVLALDRGPGMADVSRCMTDGYSTAGSPGTGLGALRRLASVLEIYSAPGAGTALLARVLPAGVAHRERARGEVGVVRVAAPGETACGDAWCLEQAGGRAVLLVVDGLGHGPHAADAASEAVRRFAAIWRDDAPEQILEKVHRALLATRGAAGSVADIDFDAGEVRFAGMGNVAGFIAWPGGSRGMMGQNGTLGGQSLRVRATSYPWTREGALIMHTDGLTSHVSVSAYPGLLARHPSLVAGVLYRDFNRGRDDATVVVLRESREPG